MKRIHILHVGVAPWEVLRERVGATLRGEIKRPADDPNIWFSSLESLTQVLSTQNRLLLDMIALSKPQSITDLAKLSGRRVSNLSRTLKMMENYGLVKLKRTGKGEVQPELLFDELRFDMSYRPGESSPKHLH